MITHDAAAMGVPLGFGHSSAFMDGQGGKIRMAMQDV